MFPPSLRAALCGPLCTLAVGYGASAHEIVGNRMFPATLTIDDPGVSDELAFPTFLWMKTADVPPAHQLDISGEWSKRITDDFAISFGETWTRISAPHMPVGYGFQNLETGLKYRLFSDAEHEFVLSAGFDVEWGGTGAAGVGADPFNTYSPALFFGKGFGDLPDSFQWLRPFAVTGAFAYDIPARGFSDGEFNPRVLEWGGSLQYSLPYLKASVADLGLPDFVNHLIPLVEIALSTPVSNTLSSGTVTTGTVNPGILWVGKYVQVGIEAMIPINSQSGHSVGVIGQLHFALDDIDPNGFGRPLFTTGIASRK